MKKIYPDAAAALDGLLHDGMTVFMADVDDVVSDAASRLGSATTSPAASSANPPTAANTGKSFPVSTRMCTV